MIREELIAHAVETLCTAADRDRGRRLALVCSSDGWRIGYQLPQLLDGDNPSCWIVLDWLGASNGHGCDAPYRFDSLGEAYAVAAELRVVILARISAVAPTGTRPELLIVVEDPAKDWTLTVLLTDSGQWRWAVSDPDGIEIAGGAGYATEDEAHADGADELSVWSRPPAVAIVV